MENELYHWGVKGMKWGIRRRRANHNSDRESTSRVTSSINRKKLEKQYKELDPASRFTKESKSFVTDVLKEVGKNTLSNLGSQFDEKAASSVPEFINRVLVELERRNGSNG